MYSISYFKHSIPTWKRKKDPILSRFFYRPLSFVGASLCAKVGISANTVSYISALVAVVASLLFLSGSYAYCIIGAVLINFWLLMDCIDGNLARSVKKQPFGEFADAMSSYILVALICPCMAVAVYHEGGVLFECGNLWIVIIGAFAGMSDTLMRLIYQKYNNTAYELYERGIIPKEKDVRTDHKQVGSFRVRVEAELGIGGLLPCAILLATLFRVLDVVVIYCFFYYGISLLAAIFLYTRKAVKAARQYNI